MTKRSPTNERFRNLFDRYGRHDSRLQSDRFQRVLHRQGIDDRCQHPHVMGRRFVDQRIRSGKLGSAKDVSAADHNGDLAAGLMSLFDLTSDLARLFAADPATARIGQTLAAELQDDATISQRGA